MNRNKIKLILTDLDGTILFPDRSYYDTVKNKINELVNFNFYIAAVTGRSDREIGNFCKEIGFNAPCVFYGGAVIKDLQKELVLHESLIETNKVFELLNDLQPFYDYVSYGVGNKTNINIDYLFKIQCYSIWFAFSLEHFYKAKKIISYYNSFFAIRFSYISKNQIGVQINNKKATKYHGANFVLKKLNLKKENLFAIGDDFNDIPLFKSAGMSVAMGNAPINVKKSADLITDTITNDGFIKAIDKYILNDK